MKIVLTGGCTGGHIYPALAIGDKFRAEDPSSEVIYVAKGEDLERQIIPAHGYELLEVDSTWFERSDPARMLVTLRRTMNGRRSAIKIMKKFRPDAVISTGSFVSVPVVLAANRLGIPVYIHEQNGFPGISNRIAAMKARKVFLGFESAREHFKRQDNIVYSGNPVRAEFDGRDKAADREALGIPADDLVILVFGGSLGSETTNMVGETIAREYAGRPGYTVIWGTGKEYYEEISARLKEEGFAPDNVRISAYISDMPAQLSACDIIVSRNLTWNLPNPGKAYEEWTRVLRTDGLLLNFDANWYSYLFDQEACAAYEQDRKNTAQCGIRDANIGENFDVMEDIARRIPLSGIRRPGWDLDCLNRLGIRAEADESFWKRVWSREEKINFSSTPMFVIRAGGI